MRCSSFTLLLSLAALIGACGPTKAGGPDAGGPICPIDQVKNGTETDVDCGGGCYTCGTGSQCRQHADCFSNSCLIGLCQGPKPTCEDQKLNNSESDIDCGGPNCEPCVPGKACAAATDCQSKVCTAETCLAPTCTDGVQNGLETGVDCGGGGTCDRCATGGTCAVATDCDQGVCVGGECLAPTCMDAVKNANETDLDCGGVCGATCADLKMCSQPGDCINGICGQGACVPAKCTDFVKNGTETDVDCGGPSCAKCAPTESCLVANDCNSGVCTANICQLPTCFDAVKNGNESDVDCGGFDCTPCADNKGCDLAQDCQSKVCSSFKCQPATCFDGVANGNEPDVDCGQLCPQQCAWGYACFAPQDCISTVDCSLGFCTVCMPGQSDCNGFTSDGCESTTSNDLSNCGGCGTVCSTANGTASCNSSSCSVVCNANFGNCDLNAQSNGCEADLLNDPAHCGGCNVSAADTDACTTDLCVNGVPQHTPVNPDDNNVCTVDACSPSTGVTHTPIVCDDADPCTQNLCNPTTGCYYPPKPSLFDFSDATGWTLGSGWQIGPAVAGSGDPGMDHTATSDNKILGYIIGGPYSTAISSYTYATSPVIDTTTATGTVTLEFWRWLTSDYPPYVYQTIDVFNGTSWVQVYNPSGGSDKAWTLVQIDVTTHKNANFQLRFGFRVGSSGAFSGGGMNADDLQLIGVSGTCP